MYNQHQLPRTLRLTLALLLLLHCTTRCATLQLEIPFGGRKCFGDVVHPATTLFAHFHASPAVFPAGTSITSRSPMTLDLFITNSRGAVVVHQSDLEEHKATVPWHMTASHAAHAAGTGTPEPLRFCIMHQVPHNHIRTPGSRRVTFTITHAPSSSLTTPPTVQLDEAKGRLLPQGRSNEIAVHVRRLEDEVNSLLLELDAIRNVEQALSTSNASSTRQILLLSLVTIVCIASVAVVQFDFIRAAVVKKHRGFE